MKRIFLLCCLGFFVLPALAVEGNHVKYVGGTLSGMNVGAVGKIETSGIELSFESSGRKIAIPYASIESFHQSTEVAHHLGILPAIAVALLKARQRRHFIGISYRDLSSDPESQVVVLEVPKGLSRSLQQIRETRVHAEAPNRPCKADRH